MDGYMIVSKNYRLGIIRYDQTHIVQSLIKIVRRQLLTWESNELSNGQLISLLL